MTGPTKQVLEVRNEELREDKAALSNPVARAGRTVVQGTVAGAILTVLHHYTGTWPPEPVLLAEGTVLTAAGSWLHARFGL